MTSAEPPAQICPLCGESVDALATECPGCGEFLAGPDLPPGTGPGQIWNSGRHLVVRKTARLPFICIKTNQPADRWVTCHLQWQPARYVVLMVLGMVFLCLPGLVVYVIIKAFVQKRCEVDVALSWPGQLRVLFIRGIAGVIGLFGVSMIAPGVICVGLNIISGTVALLILAGVFLILCAGLLGTVMGPVVGVARITENLVYLRGIHPAYRARFPNFPATEQQHVD